MVNLQRALIVIDPCRAALSAVDEGACAGQADEEPCLDHIDPEVAATAALGPRLERVAEGAGEVRPKRLAPPDWRIEVALVCSERIPPCDGHDVDAVGGCVGGILPGASNPVTYACPVPPFRDGHDAVPVRRTIFPPVAREEDAARTHREQEVTENMGRHRGAVVVPRGQRHAHPEEHLPSLSCSVEIGAYPLDEHRRIHVIEALAPG